MRFNLSFTDICGLQCSKTVESESIATSGGMTRDANSFVSLMLHQEHKLRRSKKPRDCNPWARSRWSQLLTYEATRSAVRAPSCCARRAVPAAEARTRSRPRHAG